ncbi:MAG: HAMP domain-containing histidine kinase [Lachnospiraceae bacterium]|nr:HAMP domain-containing histidine kinase [Lachnospiraceae bacterium]
MRRTLYFKFLLAYLLFAVFGFLIVASFVYSMTRDYCEREKAKNLYAEATQIANTYAADLYNSETSLETVWRQLTVIAPYLDATIWIINPSGRLVVDSSQELKPDSEIVIEKFAPEATDGGYCIIGDGWGAFPEEMLTVFSPITADYQVRAYVVIHTPMTGIEQMTQQYLNISYLLLVVLLLLSLIILFFFTSLVYIPLRRITTATEQYATGHMDYKLQIDSDDEMGYLAATLSYMAGEIDRSEEDQKKFIANVSHDFRSPLTSIRGYLIAMLDGTIPSELYEKYLRIVLNETERLTKLTNDLLSLNNLSSHGMILDRSDFDINRTIRATAATFEGVCREKNLSVDLVLTDEEMIVNADETRVQQVLYNLIDNAVKFSNRDSSIMIETTEKRSKVFVSVKDFGIGIPKEDQKLIFDRFYKSDASRGKDKKGTGLGLSIVREIIRAHEENINVVSTPGVGTEFIFSLPKADVMEEM